MYGGTCFNSMPTKYRRSPEPTYFPPMIIFLTSRRTSYRIIMAIDWERSEILQSFVLVSIDNGTSKPDMTRANGICSLPTDNRINSASRCDINEIPDSMGRNLRIFAVDV